MGIGSRFCGSFLRSEMAAGCFNWSLILDAMVASILTKSDGDTREKAKCR
jgi:hypothetical protein